MVTQAYLDSQVDQDLVVTPVILVYLVIVVDQDSVATQVIQVDQASVVIVA